MYEVRFTILNPKSEIANTVLSTSGTCRGRAATTAAGTSLRGSIISTTSHRHPKHRKYLVDMIALA